MSNLSLSDSLLNLNSDNSTANDESSPPTTNTDLIPSAAEIPSGPLYESPELTTQNDEPPVYKKIQKPFYKIGQQSDESLSKSKNLKPYVIAMGVIAGLLVVFLIIFYIYKKLRQNRKTKKSKINERNAGSNATQSFSLQKGVSPKFSDVESVEPANNVIFSEKHYTTFSLSEDGRSHYSSRAAEDSIEKSNSAYIFELNDILQEVNATENHNSEYSGNSDVLPSIVTDTTNLSNLSAFEYESNVDSMFTTTTRNTRN